jgi:hypothetical protein
MTVTAPGPLMILRVPWPMPRWRSILRAMTTVMRSHGFRQKDIFALDGLVVSPDQDQTVVDRAFAARLEAAYAGAMDKVPGFWLYDWRGDTFKLVRAATEAV